MIFLKKQTNKQQNKTNTSQKKAKLKTYGKIAIMKWKNSDHETEITNIFFFKQQ